jgi:asparagine synthase (glutamine-hydrolysing)
VRRPRRRRAADCVAEFSALLSEAVRLRLRADVPVGAYLSGGIDSSMVLGLMREHTQDPIDAFTLSFEDARFDEGDIARETAAFAGARHTVIDIDAKVLASNFEDTVWHDECPFDNANTIAKFVLSRHVRDAGLKVVLTGEGADEVLGGYAHFTRDMRRHNSRALIPTVTRHARRLRRIAGSLWSGPMRLEGGAEYSTVLQKFGFVPAQLLWPRRAAAVYAELRADRFLEFGAHQGRYDTLMRALDDGQVAGRDPLNQSLYLASKSMLPNRILTTLGDRVEMAHSIEARLPFLDHEVVEFLTRLPVEFKVRVLWRGGVGKHLLRESARGHVTDTLYRRTKHPFTAPPARASDALSEFIGDTLRGSGMGGLGLYDQKRVVKLHEGVRAGRGWAPNGLFMHIAALAVMQSRFGLAPA